MKTRGVEVVEGQIVIAFGRGVPDAFWSRLKHEMQKGQRLEEFAAEYRAEREAARAERSATDGWSSATANADREERLFRRWVEKLGLPVERWPWERGWTEELVDAYLEPVQARAA